MQISNDKTPPEIGGILIFQNEKTIDICQFIVDIPIDFPYIRWYTYAIVNAMTKTSTRYRPFSESCRLVQGSKG